MKIILNLHQNFLYWICSLVPVVGMIFGCCIVHKLMLFMLTGFALGAWCIIGVYLIFFAIIRNNNFKLEIQ